MGNYLQKITILFFTNLCFCSAGFGQNVIRLNEIKSQARQGKPEAIYQLAKIYEEGKSGDRVNSKRIYSLYLESANYSYDSAQYEVGRLSESGTGTNMDLQNAKNYYKGAADQNHAKAAFRLAQIYEREKNQELAIDYYLTAFTRGYAEAGSKLETLPVAQLANKNRPSYIMYMAEKGDPESMYKLGLAYANGAGVEKNTKKSFELFRLAARKEYGPAQYELGKIYAKGLKVNEEYVQPPSVRLAVVNYVRAANKGVAAADKELENYTVRNFLSVDDKDYQIYEARKGGGGSENKQYQLYLRYLNGNGVPKDEKKALEYCQMAALSGNADAALALADMYEKGMMLEKNLRNAFVWYKEAARLKSDTALFALADMYATGRGTEIDVAKSVRYNLKVATSSRGELSARAMYKLSRYNILQYVDQNDLDYISYLGLKGNVSAQMRLGQYYLSEGNAKAIDWFRMAAELNNAEAQKLLGDIYLYGKCKVVVDAREAASWYYMAAKSNHIGAMKELAFMYSEKLLPGEENTNQKGLQLAQKYLEIAQKNPSQLDLGIYRIIGDIYSESGEFPQAISYYNVFINGFKEGTNRSLDMLKALDGRAIAFYNIRDFRSSLRDIDLALAQIERYKGQPEIVTQYNFLKGSLHYQKGRVIANTGNQLAACNEFQKARAMGMTIDKRYLDLCGASSQRQ
ncbi:tetratricopeptide repeat protein [Flammeovirgaceae bacterium SG7u.111]|nr:tetratricopeptide repeat protein [Flammeovirgaceae bacterium SG7u.132]WPO34002.1 tetratricopeptide repeat protein [Flammeovirgaceae bacterium SG7u.111]